MPHVSKRVKSGPETYNVGFSGDSHIPNKAMKYSRVSTGINEMRPASWCTNQTPVSSPN